MPLQEQEFALNCVDSLNYVDELIPRKSQRGFFSQDITFTCIGATHKFLAIGTSIGILYLFDRKRCAVQKLMCEGLVQPLTCVMCLETVDLVIAVGTRAGLVMIFQIPFNVDANDGEGPKSQELQIRRYMVTGLHRQPITSLEWSLNGLKLFSGDLSGTVVCTQMDYVVQQSRSSVVLQEPSPIVQIHYRHHLLLISTKRRSLICSLFDDSVFSTTPVGLKQRKMLGNFGATFYESQSRPETVIFACRPSLRLWKANTSGNVLETLIFKDDPPSPTCRLVDVGFALDSTVSSRDSLAKFESQFERIVTFDQEHLLTWNDRRIYVISVAELRMLARCDGFGEVLCVSSSGDEIFVLNGPRSLVRMSDSMDEHLQPVSSSSSSPLLLPKLKSVSNQLESKWHDLNVTIEKLKPKMSKQSVAISCDDEDSTTPCEDLQQNSSDGSLLSAAVTTGSTEVKSPTTTTQLWDQFTLQDCDEDIESSIVFERKTAKRTRRRNNDDDPPRQTVIQSSSSEAGLLPGDLRGTAETSGVQASSTITLAEKEEILAKMLNLDELFPPSAATVNGLVDDSNNNNVQMLDFPGAVQSNSELLNFQKIIEEELATRQTSNNKNTALLESSRLSYEHVSCDSASYEDVYRLHLAAAGDECSSGSLSSVPDSYMSYGPPSGSSTVPSIGADCNNRSSAVPLFNHVVGSLPLVESSAAAARNLQQRQDQVSHSLPPRLQTPDVANFSTDAANSMLTDQWIQHRCPKYVKSLSVCDHYAICADAKEFVYYCSLKAMGLEWHKLDFMAKQVAVCSSGRRVWRIYGSSAYALVNPALDQPVGCQWIEAALNISYLAVDESCVWFVTVDGKVKAICDLDSTQTCGRIFSISCPWKIAQVACYNNVVWVLTADGKVACSKNSSRSHNWNVIEFEHGHVFCLALGTPDVGWLVDDSYNIWFKSGLTSSKKVERKWWHVKISDYVYQKSSTFQSFTSALKESLHSDQLTSLLRASGNLCLVATKSQGVWFYNPSEGHLYATYGSVIGGIWLWDGSSKLHHFSPALMNMAELKLPEPSDKNPLLCVSAAPETLWVLLESGSVYIRKGISIHRPTGSEWTSLDLFQIANYRLVYVSCGMDVVWACDSQGRILMRIGKLQAPSADHLSPAWVPVVDEAPSSSSGHVEPFFVKVFVGPTSYTVWAIDAKQNVYVREGVFPDLLIGVGWVLVAGVQATSLAISEQAAYALTSSGVIFRRCNITQNNYIGDYWRELPGRSSHLSVSVNDNLWAIDKNGALLQHQVQVVSCPVRNGHAGMVDRQNSVTEEEWEIVDMLGGSP